ncbi:MAG TPA: oligosaccharide flippase family protein [Puia sp.]|nr:oligosaccharide flippase family protein [Puia sp.]
MIRGLLFPEEGLTAGDRRRIIRGTLNSFLIQGFSVLLVFVSNWWIIHSSDADSYGRYVHVFNWVSILGVIVLGGRDDLVLAQLPKFIRAGWHRRLAGLVKSVNGWILFAALVVCVAFLTLITVFPLRSLSENEVLFRYGLCAVYFSACLGLNQMILQAMNHVRLSQVVEKLARPLLLIVFTALFHAAGIGFDPVHLVVLGTLVSGVCCGIVLLLAFGKTGRYRDRAAEEPPQEPLTRSTFYFFVISLMNLLATKITMLLLPLFTPVQDIGIFNICYRLADLLIFPFFLMHTVLPQLFARHSPEEKDYTRSLFRESNRLMVLLALPLLLVNLLAGRFVLGLFGPAFGKGYTALVYISLAQLLFCLFGPANTILMTQGRERYSAGCLIAYVALLALTSRLLIPVSGITGGALAILVSSAGYNLLLAVVVYRSYGVSSLLIGWLTPLIPRKRR